MVYTGRELISVVNSRGWNLYDSTDVQGNSSLAIKSIVEGPVSKLRTGNRYVLLPTHEESSNPEIVFGELERVALALNRKTPTIKISESRYPLTGFTIVNKDIVKVNTPDGDQRLSYLGAIASAETLFNTRTLRYD